MEVLLASVKDRKDRRTNKLTDVVLTRYQYSSSCKAMISLLASKVFELVNTLVL